MNDMFRDRRSIRTFGDKPVPDGMIDKVLEAGRWAPSGMNNQPWRFAVVRDHALKQEMSALTINGSIVRSADVLIAVFFDRDSGYDRTKDLMSIGACMENMLLAIHNEGLGGVWLGEILKNASKVCVLLEAPEGYELVAVIALGHPAGRQPSAPERKPLSELVFLRK